MNEAENLTTLEIAKPSRTLPTDDEIDFCENIKNAADFIKTMSDRRKNYLEEKLRFGRVSEEEIHELSASVISAYKNLQIAGQDTIFISKSSDI